ncbi:MAG: hypothetical protein ALECFALPRED_010642 [Alectoria fallacina]|uniref:Uncharacterized protein n=1 Tax=Alectoria fallacina TaxID=1903189 RepID=A0A8H3I2N0_9LECA|nr:MAG: hypothetical protein ALECFALPRED_010642 [Alectoria fallacina]
MDVSKALKTLDLQSMDPEEQVVIAYYALASTSTSAKAEAKTALAVIANAKASKWLLFALGISEHLNVHNLSTLIVPPANVPRNLEDRSKEGPPHLNGSISESIFSRVHPPHTPSSYNTWSAGSTPELLASEFNSEADTDCSEDLEDELFHLRRDVWRCNECNAELIDGECPDGHNLSNRCEECGENCLERYCRDCVPLSCRKCGYLSIRDVCLICGYDREDGDKEMSNQAEEKEILFDEHDGVWRCVHCQWEVEWDNEGIGEAFDIGTCQCMIEDGRPRQIDLVKYPDYEPAYCILGDSGQHHSDLNSPQSSDSEGDSDDEHFIDDDSDLMDDTGSNHKFFLGYAGNNHSALETYVTAGASRRVDHDAEKAVSSLDESMTLLNARGSGNSSDIELG